MKTYFQKEAKNLGNITTELWNKLWSRINVVEDETSCWEWQGKSIAKGYPYIHINDENRNERANRLVWIACKSLLPKELLVLHNCNNSICCRPTHLKAGTSLDNAYDKIACGHSNAGEHHPNSKLTKAKVVAIRAIAALGTLSQTDLGKMFGIHESTVSGIVNGKTWNRANIGKA